MKRSLLMTAIVVFLVTVAGMGDSQAWFQTKVLSAEQGELGQLNLELDTASSRGRIEGLEGFSLKNTGSLPVYVRFGYTFVYKNADGRELMKDVSGLELDGLVLNVDGNPINAELLDIPMAKGYDKSFVVPCSDTDSRFYYKLAPGETLNGSYRIGGISGGSEGQTLQVAWTAEALHASKGALRDAEGYGWEPARAR